MGEQDKNKGTAVSILGKEFRIGCPKEQEDSLKLAAGYLDKQMRQIRLNGRIVGTERIAVMAALNIAHELITLHQGPDAPVDDLSNRIELLKNKIDDAIIRVQTKKDTTSSKDDTLSLQSESQQAEIDFSESEVTYASTKTEA